MCHVVIIESQQMRVIQWVFGGLDGINLKTDLEDLRVQYCTYAHAFSYATHDRFKDSIGMESILFCMAHFFCLTAN